jgi:CRP/FNR family transcriptional regulator, cyclic AMP receptor protein
MCKIRDEQLFSGVSAQTLQELDTIKQTRTYHKSALLFAQGQSPRGIFILCTGGAKLTLSLSHGKSFIVGFAVPGDILGLSTTLSGQPYQVSAEAIEVCQVKFVKREDFLRLVKQRSDLCLSAAVRLGEELSAARFEMGSRGQSVNAKLAKLLLQWRPTNGTSFGQQGHLDLHLSQEEIGDTIGVARETVSRAFSNLKKRGILRGSRSTWVICNERALKAIAEDY